MKQPPLRPGRGRSPAGRRSRGIALIIVLASLALLTILVLAFLTGVSSELQSSKMYANGSSVKLLAQSAVALVMGEIQAATADQTQCWASEPGMIRTYDNTGKASGYYKLYSDSTMNGTGAFDHTSTANLVPSHLTGGNDWYNQAGVYVDLNQPVSVNGTNYYPILDGNSADYTTQYTNPSLAAKTVPAPSSSTISSLAYSSSAALGANNLPGVTGFWLNANTPVDNASNASPNVAPMPVKWLYVLKNGEVIVPDSNPTNNVVTFNSAAVQPSSNDPIVGRIAFWTDDETCKVNINTASGGNTTSATSTSSAYYGLNTSNTIIPGTASSFWDTPRVLSPQDYAYATYQPAQNEFQRYPGHPATVDLSAVFNSLTADTKFPEDLYSTPGNPAVGITPRTTAGGSKEGTVSVLNLAGSSALTPLGTRLYSTPDEFLFQPTLASGTPGQGLRSLNAALLSTYSSSNTSNTLDQTDQEKAKFFITANSEAPDVNVFNLPRISMWPITLNGGVPTETAFDQLIAFCSTINGSPYYFQRQDPTSATNDLPAGGSSTGLGRNRQLLEYLRTLTQQAIPGFGGSLAAKYNTTGAHGDCDQILTEMFDYIRSTNLQDTSTGATPYAKALTAAGYSGTGTGLPYTQGGIGQVVPIIDQNITITDPSAGTSGTSTDNPRGFGRFPTVHQAALVFIGAGDNATESPSTPPQTGTPALTAATDPNPPTSYTPQVAAGSQRVQAGFFLQMFDPSEGTPVSRPAYQIKVTGLEKLQWNGNPIFPAGAAFPYYNSSTGGIILPIAAGINGQTLEGSTGQTNGFAGYSYGSLIDFRQLCSLGDSITGGNYTAAGKWKVPVYPLISPPTGPTSTSGPDLPSGGTFAFSSTGDVTVQIFPLSSSGIASNTAIQTIYLKFPPASFPVPTSIDNNPIATKAGYTPASTGGDTPAVSFLPSPMSGGSLTVANVDFLSFLDSYTATTLGAGIGRLGFPSYIPWLSTNDVVRALVATPGDMRLIAARQFVPDTFYQPLNPNAANGLPATCSYYGGTAAPFSHMLRITTGEPFYGSIGGKLIVASTAYDNYQTQNFVFGGSTSYGSTYSFAGGTGERAMDCDVPNQASSVTVTQNPTGTAPGPTAIPGDWDNGLANTGDGAFINKADEGDAGTISGGAYAANGNPYYELDYGDVLPGPTFFSPNRMIPSPGMFGSLPTQVWANTAWQTLLFRPGPAGHFGLGTPKNTPPSGTPPAPPYSSPPDHLFLDLFNMPVVEPYAISTPLATAGRINMNYLIVPFTYINRDTGLRAAMKNQMVMAIPSSYESKYKSHQNVAAGWLTSSYITKGIRYTINLDSTLSQFLARFYPSSSSVTPDIFHSASEICDIDLVPNDPTAPGVPITRSNMDAYWTVNSLTGDNDRERPYANLYPLLTTKSNTYTVHYRVQTLKQALPPSSSASAWQSWREGTDVVTAEYRGSETIERYIDPNATTNDNGATMPDYATQAANSFPPTPSLSQFYKLRVVSSKPFPP